MAQKPKKLLDRVREIIRLKQYSNENKQAYFFNGLRAYDYYHYYYFDPLTFLYNYVYTLLGNGFKYHFQAYDGITGKG